MPTPLTLVRLGGRPDLPLLVLGPAEGRAATDLWGPVARHLVAEFHVLAWDLPGHGTNRAVVDGTPGVPDLGDGLLDLVDATASGFALPAFAHVGVGVGGEVGLDLRARLPDRVVAVLVLDPADLADPASAAALVREHLLGRDERAVADAPASAVADLVDAVRAAVAAARDRGLGPADVEEAVRRALLEDSAP